jgi:hypothetical protein
MVQAQRVSGGSALDSTGHLLRQSVQDYIVSRENFYIEEIANWASFSYFYGGSFFWSLPRVKV